jgi:tRNA modification GTPase
MIEDTIAALATPLGEGGLAVIRVSGANAISVVDSIFQPAGKKAPPLAMAPTHTLHFGKVIRSGKVIDEAIASIMRAPRSFTREDVVELSCHGGVFVAKAVLDGLLDAGARLAEPGEFTKRAFLNGRIDLAQAEAVADVIHARTELALAAANEQLSGKLSRKINELRDRLMAGLAHLEAHIDFPDEDIAPDTRDGLIQRFEKGLEFIELLVRTAQEGRVLRRGIRAAILGRPNAGKSSLLNQLLGHDRAIVSPIPGTTRDTIEETANIRGLPIIFIDTAGLREASDVIEREGIRRTLETGARAELILHVVDASEPLSTEDQRYFDEFTGRKRIIIENKCDLPRALRLPGELSANAVAVSCASGEGIEPLKDRMRELAWAGQLGGEMLEVMINSRHEAALRRAGKSLGLAVSALRAGAGLELVSMDLRAAANAVGEVVGKTTTEDLLDSIFSQFCLGK